MKRTSKNGSKKTAMTAPESELGRRLREIKARIVASGVYLFKNDEEVLEEVRRVRAGDFDSEPKANLRRLERLNRRRAQKTTR